jgi:hypothetical protein
VHARSAQFWVCAHVCSAYYLHTITVLFVLFGASCTVNWRPNCATTAFYMHAPRRFGTCVLHISTASQVPTRVDRVEVQLYTSGVTAPVILPVSQCLAHDSLPMTGMAMGLTNYSTHGSCAATQPDMLQDCCTTVSSISPPLQGEPQPEKPNCKTKCARTCCYRSVLIAAVACFWLACN